jgi:predicted nucleotidyltransferase
MGCAEDADAGKGYHNAVISFEEIIGDRREHAQQYGILAFVIFGAAARGEAAGR